MKIATLKDIAKKANVSIMTISNVINGNRHKVSEETFEKVSTIIKELNYIPNANARSLAKKKTKIIALCIPSYFGKSLLDDPYNSYITGAVEKYIQELDYNLMLVSKTKINEIIESLVGWNVDGVIALSMHEKDIKVLDERLDIPLVLLDSYYESNSIPSIGTDDYKGGWLAGKYLVQMGHRCVAIASGPELLNDDTLKTNRLLMERYTGFKTALEEEGLVLKKENIFGEDISYEGGVVLGKQIGNINRITAVFCTADILAAGIIEGARKVGKNTPNDLSVIGFDDLPISQYVSPKITTIKQKNKEKGERAVDILMGLLTDNGESIKQVKLNVELIERQSVLNLNK